MYAASSNNGDIRVICADISVIADPEHPGHADAVQTIIAISATIVIRARRRIVGEHASIQRVAGVGGADIVVVAGPGRADTDPIGTRVVHGTGIEITTGCPIRLPIARTTYLYTHTIARCRIAGIGRACIVVVAVPLRPGANRVRTGIV